MKRNVCECGGVELYASATADSRYILRDGKWVHDGYQEYPDRSTITCGECDNQWEEYLSDDNDEEDATPDKCWNPLPSGIVGIKGGTR